MTTVMLPIVLWDIICEFAYNVMCKKDMLEDVEYQLTVQKNIPMLFFTQSIPTKPLFCKEWYRTASIAFRAHRLYVELFTLNPLRKGNPYFPTSAIHRQARVISEIPLDAWRLLKNEVVRKNRKYKGSLFKNVMHFVNTSQCWLQNWNTALSTIFLHDFWYDVHSYEARDHLERGLILRWVESLEAACFGHS